MAKSWFSFLTRVEIVTMRPIPAARARDTIPSRSSAKSGKSKWQWLSTSMVRTPLGCRLDVTWEGRCRRRQRRSRRDARCAAERGEVALGLGDAEAVQQQSRGRWHHRLGKDRDLADDFG